MSIALAPEFRAISPLGDPLATGVSVPPGSPTAIVGGGYVALQLSGSTPVSATVGVTVTLVTSLPTFAV